MSLSLVAFTDVLKDRKEYDEKVERDQVQKDQDIARLKVGSPLVRSVISIQSFNSYSDKLSPFILTVTLGAYSA